MNSGPLYTSQATIIQIRSHSLIILSLSFYQSSQEEKHAIRIYWARKYLKKICVQIAKFVVERWTKSAYLWWPQRRNINIMGCRNFLWGHIWQTWEWGEPRWPWNWALIHPMKVLQIKSALMFQCKVKVARGTGKTYHWYCSYPQQVCYYSDWLQSLIQPIKA